MKKLITILLAVMMVLSLAACGGGNDTPDPSGSEDNTPSSSQQDEQPSNTPDEDDNSEDSNEVKLILKTNPIENGMYNAEFRNYRTSYTEYYFNANDKFFAKSKFYTFDSAEEAQKYVDYQVNNKNADESIYAIEDSLLIEKVDVSDDPSLGFSLDSLKPMFTEGEYTIEEK